MTEDIKNRIAKVYELVNRGDQGEKEAAKHALDKLMKRYNLSSADIESLKLERYGFKYSNNLEMWLLNQIVAYFLGEDKNKGFRQTVGVRQIVLSLEYVDYIIVSTAYEYFKKHMMAQYKIFVLPHVKRCRSTKTKNKKRAELQDVFYSKYIIASNLYNPNQLTQVKLSELSVEERKQRQMLQGVEGGKYHTPVTTGLYLE